MNSKIVTTAIALVLAGAAAGCASWDHARTASNGTEHRSPARTLTDAEITAKVKAKLIADSVVKARHIDVDTKNGFVTLYGDVHNPREVERAEGIARDTEGVTGVRSSLNVIG
jgi:osmotically-inducible protein OsmY